MIQMHIIQMFSVQTAEYARILPNYKIPFHPLNSKGEYRNTQPNLVSRHLGEGLLEFLSDCLEFFLFCHEFVLESVHLLL